MDMMRVSWQEQDGFSKVSAVPSITGGRVWARSKLGWVRVLIRQPVGELSPSAAFHIA
jgi:hypothetical protein